MGVGCLRVGFESNGLFTWNVAPGFYLGVRCCCEKATYVGRGPGCIHPGLIWAIGFPYGVWGVGR